MTRPIKCPQCDGKGWGWADVGPAYADRADCPACNGSGRVYRTVKEKVVKVVTYRPAPARKS
jgi:DnaJ-class molecular chaperone